MNRAIQDPRDIYRAPRLISAHLLAMSVCIIFSICYVNGIYDAFGADHWFDLRTYESVFNDPYYHYAQLNRSWISWIRDEPLWYETVLAARAASWTYTETINFISIVSAALISYIIYRLCNNKLWPLILMINPSTIDLLIAQVRSALAFSVLMIVFLNPPWWIRLLIIVMAGTIHTSMYLFGALYIFILIYGRYASKYQFLKSTVFLITAAALVAFMISFAAPYILGAIGDRRVNIATDALGFLFSLAWLGFVVSYYAIAKFDEQIFPHFFYSICAFIGLFSIFTDAYGSRYIAVALPFLIVMIARQRGAQQRWLLIQYCATMSVYYYYYLWQAGVI
jgi:EpsG family